MRRDSMTSIKPGKFRVVRPEKNGLMTEQVVIQVRDMIRDGKLCDQEIVCLLKGN